MSFAEHQSLGREIKALCQSLIDISINLQTTYGVTSKVGKDYPMQDPKSFKGLYY